jgi:hypothetical protein
MHWTHEIDPLHCVSIVTVSGELTDLYDELRDAPGVGSDFALLLDLRRASERNVTSSGVSALARLPPVLSVKARRAVVVSSDFGFGMARMYGLRREVGSGGIEVFRDFAAALRCVGIEDE